jgi:hypothetical protein
LLTHHVGDAVHRDEVVGILVHAIQNCLVQVFSRVGADFVEGSYLLAHVIQSLIGEMRSIDLELSSVELGDHHFRVGDGDPSETRLGDVGVQLVHGEQHG